MGGGRGCVCVCVWGEGLVTSKWRKRKGAWWHVVHAAAQPSHRRPCSLDHIAVLPTPQLPTPQLRTPLLPQPTTATMLT